MAKNVETTITETTTEKYDGDDFRSMKRITITTTKLVNGKEISKSSVRRIEPELNFTKEEYCKALVLANAKYGSVHELPFTIGGLYDSFADSDAVQWRCALDVQFLRRLGEKYVSFRERIASTDFRVYDNEKADKILNDFKQGKQNCSVQIDADLIIQGELGELPQQQGGL